MPIRQCTARAVFRRVAKAADLPPLTPHSARHFHATALLAVGTPVADVSRRLGHSDSSVTWSIYVHPQTEAENVGVEKLASVLAAARGSR